MCITKPLTLKTSVSLLSCRPELLNILKTAPLMAQERMEYINRPNTKMPINDKDCQLPPSVFHHLTSLQEASLKFNETSDLSVLEPCNYSLRSLHVRLHSAAHNSSKVFNLDLAATPNLRTLRVTGREDMISCTLAASGLPTSLENIEIIAPYKTVILMNFQEALSQLLKDSKRKPLLRSLKADSVISEELLDLLSDFKALEQLKFQADSGQSYKLVDWPALK